MEEPRMARTAERLGAVTGLVAVAGVGAGALAAALSGNGPPQPGHLGWWWAVYILYVLAFLAADEQVTVPRWLSEDTLVVVQVGAGITALLVWPQMSWTAILLVVSTASAAFVWSPRSVAVVVVLQSAAIGAAGLAVGWPVADVLLAVLAYTSFQGFAAVVVATARREAESARRLAAAHAELRAASVLLESTSRDAERLRIARELHDVVGHQLTALTLELEVAGHLTDGEGAAHVASARRVAKELLGDVRATVGRLRAPQERLEPLLRAVVTDLPGLDVRLTVREEVPVHEDRALAVLRCVQEVVTNTVRHADARHLSVRVVADDEGVRVVAEDDGRGAAEVGPGNGLAGMRERFEALGGSLSVRTSPGRGFRLEAHAPAPERSPV